MMNDFEVKDLVKMERGSLRHLACRRYCLIKEGQKGTCSVYENRKGRLYSLGYGHVSSFAIDPIEKKPLYHFHPASKVFSIGGVSCNFACPGCQNSLIAHFRQTMLDYTRYLKPEQLVQMAQKAGCSGLAFTYNEPTVYAEYVLDTFQLAKAKDLYTVYVTNGYMAPELLDKLITVLDAASIDIKAFSKTSMKKMTGGVSDFEGILDTCMRLKKSGVHVEIVTNIMPSVNDDMSELTSQASWVCDNLGAETPFHITRYIPQPTLPNVPATDYNFFDKVMAQNWRLGLKYTYVGNMPNHSAQNTFCASCGNQLIGRFAQNTIIKGLAPDGTCRECGQNAHFVL